MQLTHVDRSAFADEFRRLASSFRDAATKWREENLPLKLSAAEMAGRAEYAQRTAELSPFARAQWEQFHEQSEQSRQSARERKALAACRPDADRAGRLIVILLDQEQLKDLAPLKVAATTITGDGDSVAAFWWNSVVPTLLIPNPCADRDGIGDELATKFERGALACEVICNVLTMTPSLAQVLPELTMKGLVEATGESKGTIREAAKKAKVKRPGRGQHGFEFSPDDVYLIAFERLKSRHFDLATRQKWNDLLKKIGKSTLEEPRQAVRPTRAK